jgi:hypothetical protein
MSVSTAALSTWTSRPCKDASPRLTGELVPRTMLGIDDRDQMYDVFSRHFAGTDRTRFEIDLAEKETVIVLRDRDRGAIRGFSTLMRINTRIDDADVVAFFSGDTIVDPAYWGDFALSRMWASAVFGEADRLAIESPATRVFWFLICSGYKTWRFLPVFFREFYPNADAPTPAFHRRLLDALGRHKFGDEYIPGAGIVRFANATPLRDGVAEITEGRLRDPRIAFFVRANPGHAAGDELACIAEVSRANLTRAGRRMVDG